MRRVLVVGLLALAALRAGVGCTSFDDAGGESAGDSDAGASADAGTEASETAPDGAAADALVPVDGGPPTFRFGADGGAGDFTTVGNGPFLWLADDQGKPYVRISGQGTFERAAPVQAKRIQLSFRVRVVSGPDGGNPYINVAGMTVGVTFADAGDLYYVPRVLQQRQTIELGAEELPSGGYRSASRTATPTVWTSYALTYAPSTGAMSLTSSGIADAVLPFALATNVNSIQVRAGAMAPEHVVELADLALTYE